MIQAVWVWTLAENFIRSNSIFRACGHSIGGVHNVTFPQIGLFSYTKASFKASKLMTESWGSAYNWVSDTFLVKPARLMKHEIARVGSTLSTTLPSYSITWASKDISVVLARQADPWSPQTILLSNLISVFSNPMVTPLSRLWLLPSNLSKTHAFRYSRRWSIQCRKKVSFPGTHFFHSRLCRELRDTIYVPEHVYLLWMKLDTPLLSLEEAILILESSTKWPSLVLLGLANGSQCTAT